MVKETVKLVEVKSILKYPYNGLFRFNINLIDMKYYIVERVRRCDGLLTLWQPRITPGSSNVYKTLDDAENAIVEWAKRPVQSHRTV